MSDYPLAQFVSAPSSAATIRYDFNVNDSSARCHLLGAGDLDLGVPSFTGEPEGVGADYGYRSMRFTQRIQGAKAVAFARQSALAKELLRATNWLKFQWSPMHQPVYFKTYRGEPGALSVELGDVADAWDIAVPLVAEGFAYGARVNIPTVQIVQAPADLTGPTRYAMRYVLPAIKGDAPTPLRISITPTTGNAWRDAEWLVGCTAGSTDMASPVINIGTSDGFTPSSGGAVTTGDPTFFSGDYRTMTLTTTEKSLSTTALAVTTRGRYKMLLRAEFITSTGLADPDSTVIFRVLNGELSIPSTTLSFSPEDFQGWVDLGEVSFPGGATLPDDQSGTVTPRTLYVGMSTTAATVGTVTAKLDALTFVPVGGPTVESATMLRPKGRLSNLVVNNFGAGVTATYDGDSELAWFTDAGDVLDLAPNLSGGFPVADPAAEQNLLTTIAMSRGRYVSTGPWITTTGAVADVDVSYHPRWLYVGDGT